MRFRVLIAASLISVLIFAGWAQARPYTRGVVSLQGCYYVNKPNRTTRGRFIWKPTGAHFPTNAVIVSPSYYYPNPPIVQVLTMNNQLIEVARLKTSGNCAGSPECLFAATYLTYKNGSGYSRGYKSIKVKISPQYAGSIKACTYYVIKKPASRAEFYGRLTQ